MVAIFARQRDSVGLYDVCTNAVVRSDESNLGQTGWDIGITYDTKEDLLSQINQRLRRDDPISRIRNWINPNDQIPNEHISQLGISCHGSDDGSNPNTFGGVAIEGRSRTWLRSNNIQSFLPFLNAIGQRLEPNAVVYLFSCRVGGTDNGRNLLIRLSEVWQHRRVVGFIPEGSQRRGGQWRPGERCELPGVQFEGRWGSWNIPAAVSARNGEIVQF